MEWVFSVHSLQIISQQGPRERASAGGGGDEAGSRDRVVAWSLVQGCPSALSQRGRGCLPHTGGARRGAQTVHVHLF